MTRMTAVCVMAALLPVAAGGAACSRPRAAAEAERPTVSVVKITRGDL